MGVENLKVVSIFNSAMLYPILDFDYCNTRNISLLEPVRLWEKFPDCISFFQLRAKSLNLLEYTKLYSQLKKTFPQANIIINDFWEFAIEIHSFGIHIGKEDYAALSEVDRANLRNATSILKGTSSHSIEDLLSLESGLWDYSGFGPIFPTATKQTTNPILGVAVLQKAIRGSKVPLVPIGGIDSDNFASLFGYGKIVPASISMMTDEKSLIKIVDFIRKHTQPVS